MTLIIFKRFRIPKKFIDSLCVTRHNVDQKSVRNSQQFKRFCHWFRKRLLIICNFVELINRLAEVGRLETPKLEGKYETGQLFLHRVFGYRGVTLFPWMARVYDRDVNHKNQNRFESIEMHSKLVLISIQMITEVVMKAVPDIIQSAVKLKDTLIHTIRCWSTPETVLLWLV